jgi:hypothetical protein
MDGCGWIMRKKGEKNKRGNSLYMYRCDGHKMKSRARLSKYTTPKGNEKKNKGAIEWKNNNNFPLSAFSHLKMAMGEEEEEEELSFKV